MEKVWFITGANRGFRILIGKDCCQQVKADLHDQLQDIKRYEQAASRTDFAASRTDF